MWVASRATRDHQTILGVFCFLDQARDYVEQQLMGHAVVWTAPASSWRTWRCQAGEATYQIDHHAVRDRREGLRLLVATRAWHLRCGHCGTDWIATAADVLAGDDWLVCPRCHRWHPEDTRERPFGGPPDLDWAGPDAGVDPVGW